MLLTIVFNELCVKITLLRSIPKKIETVCNAVYFRLCIDLMHITPPVTAEGFDGSNHPRCADWDCGAEYEGGGVSNLNVLQRM